MYLSLLPLNNQYNNNKGALKGPLHTMYLGIIGSYGVPAGAGFNLKGNRQYFCRSAECRRESKCTHLQFDGIIISFFFSKETAQELKQIRKEARRKPFSNFPQAASEGWMYSASLYHGNVSDFQLDAFKGHNCLQAHREKSLAYRNKVSQ